MTTTTPHAVDLHGHPVAAPDQWLERRLALLARERALMQLHDEVARERRALPWRRLERDYVFDTPAGPRRLAELFGDKRQLLLQHFMLAPGEGEGCRGCSFMADHVDPMLPHLAQRDVAFVAVSRAPLAEIERFRERMGWRFPWVSSHGSAFNADFGVSFTPAQRAGGEVPYNYAMRPFPHADAPGVSVFAKDGAGEVFHAYATFGRGVEVMMGTYALLDLVPRGRDEAPGQGMAWLRHHDRYEQPAPPPACCGAA